MQCPLLCKEFVIDAWQIYYARSKGADAILLIAAVLPDLDMKYMVRVCKNLGMTALIEVCFRCLGSWYSYKYCLYNSSFDSFCQLYLPENDKIVKAATFQFFIGKKLLFFGRPTSSQNYQIRSTE
jgi:hypothetical protein